MNLHEVASRGMKGQVAVDELVRIANCTDIAWLRGIMANSDNQITIRSAAERRVRQLDRERKKR